MSNLAQLLREYGQGVGETALSLGTGMAAQIPAGIGGIAEFLRSQNVDRKGSAASARSAADKVNELAERYTYQPRGDTARRGIENIGKAVETVTEPLKENIADPVGDRFPMLGAALLAGTELIGPKGAKAPKVRGGLSEILREGKAPGIPVSSESGAILPRGAETRIPAEQSPIPRLTPTGREPEPNERSVALLRSKKAAGAVDDLIAKGRDINPELENWYHSKPLMDFALNEGLSPEEFRRMMAQFSSASQRNPVLRENALGSFMWGMDRRGEFNPDSLLLTKARANELRGNPNAVAIPKGMGSLAQSSIFDRAKRMALGESPEAIMGPKLNSYIDNKMGNEVPVTVDVNALHGPVMAGRLPDWLKTNLVDDNTKKVIARPRDDYAAGDLKMKEALKRPGFWEDAPATPGEYGAFEELWRRGADRAGVTPAGAQALGWYGSADVTALKTPPKTYMELLEQSARSAAARQGVTPVEAMRRAVRGERGGQLGFSKLGAAAALGGATAGGMALSKYLRGSGEKKEEEKVKPPPPQHPRDAFIEKQLQKMEGGE